MNFFDESRTKNKSFSTEMADFFMMEKNTRIVFVSDLKEEKKNTP